MTQTIKATEPTTAIEWAVQLVWPDGHTEIREERSRDAAEGAVDLANRELRRRPEGPTATLMSQAVTRSGLKPHTS